MTPARMSLGRRAFRCLLRLLPGEFRGDFGDAIGADIDRADGDRDGVAWWTREIPGLLAAIVREHLAGIGHDARDSVRQLTRTPGFTAAAVLMLAVGTGANAAVFSVVDAVVLRPAFPDAGRVVGVEAERPNGTHDYSLTIGEWHALAAAPSLAAVGAVDGRYTVLSGANEDRRFLVECVSAPAWSVMGVSPAIGRVFDSAEDRSAAPVIVIGQRAWQALFAGRPDVLGQTVTLDGQPLTVIGVMPRGFLGAWAQSDTEAWVPLGEYVPGQAQGICRTDSNGTRRTTIQVYARVRPPFNAASAAANVTAAGLVDGRTVMVPTYESTYDSYRGPLVALIGVVACVLLIACANVANLQLERLSARRRELAVRLALGATFARIVRQTLVENLLLSLAGAAVGLGVARATLTAIARMMPPTMPNVSDITVDGRVLGFTIGLTIAAGIAVGLAPVFQALRARGSPYHVQLSTRGATSGALWTRRALVVIEVALSVALVIGAGLMVRTLLALQQTDLGFETSNRFSARTLLSDGWRATAGHRQFADDVLARLRTLPNVDDASVSSYLPMSGYSARTSVRVEAAGPAAADVWTAWASPGFIADMGMRVVRGRPMSSDDTAGSLPVAIVNETMARQFFPKGDAIGRTLEVTPRGAVPTVRTIVGILADARQSGRDRRQWPEIYVPFAQEPGPALLYFVVKTSGHPSAALPAEIKAAVREVRPGQTVEELHSLDDIVARSFARPRFGAWLFGILAAMAAGLAALGLGAVIAWWVTDRRREIGVRMALGAGPGHAVALVIRQVLALTLAGLAIGAGVAAAFTRLLSDWLYGVTPTDLGTFSVGVIGMLLAAGAAAFLPARRASRVDPATTLRTE